eukprot:5806202-Lingulodinium_polyedra.AAC.1
MHHTVACKPCVRTPRLSAEIDAESGAAVLPERIAAASASLPATSSRQNRQPQHSAERQRKIQAAKEERERISKLPENKCAKWRAGLVRDIDVCEQSIVAANNAASMPQPVAAEYRRMFEEHKQQLKELR